MKSESIWIDVQIRVSHEKQFSGGGQTEFAQKLELVDTMCLELIHKDGTSLLESAGYTSSSYPWDEAAYEKYTAVLEAVGVEQG